MLILHVLISCQKLELSSFWDGWPCQIKVGLKVGGCCAPFLGGAGSLSITMSPVIISAQKLHLDPSSRLATTDIDRKFGGCAPFAGEELSPYLTECGLGRGLPPSALRTKWHPTVWQYTSVTNRTVNGLIALCKPFYRRSPKKSSQPPNLYMCITSSLPTSSQRLLFISCDCGSSTIIIHATNKWSFNILPLVSRINRLFLSSCVIPVYLLLTSSYTRHLARLSRFTTTIIQTPPFFHSGLKTYLFHRSPILGSPPPSVLPQR